MRKLPPLRKEHAGLLSLLLVFLTLSVAWNLTVPAYENLDEIEHTEVIRHIAVTGRLPSHGEAEAAGFRVRQEASQPPLYHILGAGWVRLWRLPTSPPTATPIPGKLVDCGTSATYYNKVTWQRDAYAGPPWEGHRRTVHGLRLLSTLLQLTTVAGTWVLARRLLSPGPALLAAASVAFNPQFLLVAAGVNNDNLVTPLVTWALVLLVEMWQNGPTPTRLVGFGLLAGLAGLSKLSGLGLLALGGGALLLYAWRARTPFLKILGQVALLGLPALLLVAPWLARNLRLYGDLTALTPMLTKVGRNTGNVDLWGTFQLMTRSYWGQLPCSFYPRALYWPFFLLLGGGVLGVVVGWRNWTRTRREGLFLMGTWFALIVAAWSRWNALTPAFGGRLLFPAAPALAVLLAAGWHTLGGRLAWRLWGVWLPLGALLTLLTGVAPLFAPPPLLDAATAPPNPQTITFDDAISLRGYKAQLVEPRLQCWFAKSSYCRPALDVTLYWQTEQPPRQDWVLALQLVSARPGDDDLRLSYDAWPGHGNLPTSRWPTGTLIADHYLLPLPESDAIRQAWDVQVAFYDADTGDRFPMTSAGQPAGDTVTLTTLRLPDRQPDCSTLPVLQSPVHFGDAIALTHAASLREADTWHITLCWESLAPLADDYTVFIHAYAADGTLLGTGDGPPMNQAFPTQLWEPGDRVLDTHTLSLSTETEPARIAVGLYQLQTGLRLPTTANGQRLPDDTAIIWQASKNEAP